MITDYDKAQLTNWIANNVKCQPSEAALIVRHVDHYFESASRIATLEAEIVRVKGLIQKAFDTFHMKGFPHNEPTWEQFKSTHNL